VEAIMSQARILFLAANPSNTTALALDQECAAVEHELRIAPHRDFELASRWVVRTSHAAARR
jgi:hypothetical protein